MMSFKTALLFLTAFSIAYAQDNGEATTTIHVSLINALSITSQDNSTLDYGAISLSGNQLSQIIGPESGASFLVLGHPDKDIFLSFSETTLDNTIWSKENKGKQGTLTFVPSVVHTKDNAIFSNPTGVSSGGTYKLTKNSSVGKLYLWVGGKIDIKKNQPEGDYTGTFTINVTY